MTRERGLTWGDVGGLLAALFHGGVILLGVGLLLYGLVVLLANWIVG